ncbi:hypothetical protein CPT_Silence61 [Bacillus phage Silence]|nr:hypothetical protein CPT_Silence61 [Bacillus phage Silence]
MSFFNKGFMCPECGPVPLNGSVVRSINKAKFNACKVCASRVTPWERPLNERAGRCGNCAGTSFKSAIVKHQFLRCCNDCGQVLDVDSNKIIREGDQDKKWI